MAGKFTAADREKWQQETDQRTKELTEKLENGVKELFSSDKYKDYLKSMSHFHNYSSRNIMLIHTQMPGATKVASFKLWKEQFNRSPKKGETSLRIWAPIGKKEPETKLFEKIDPETKKPMLDKDGNTIMEELTSLSSLNMRFKLVPVFDVSQTVGEPLPQLAEDLTGNVEHYAAFLDTLKAVSPLPIEFEALNPEQDGYCRFGEKIGIREGMSEIQTVSAIIHEITHARLHDKDITAEHTQPTAENAVANEQSKPAKKSKEVKEIEAESVSYVVCQKYDIETGDNSFGYLASWSSHDMADFKASLDTIRKEANNLITAIDGRFAAICKERGIDLTAQEQSVQTQSKPEQEQPQQSQSQSQVQTQTQQKPNEPEFTTESTTQTIAGVDFVVEEVKPVVSEIEQTAATHDPIHEFASDYHQYITDAYRNGVPRDTPAQIESDIAGLADILRNGKTDNFREAIERAGNNSGTQERAAALLQRLDEMLPNTTQSINQTKSAEQQNYQKLAELFSGMTKEEFLYQRFESTTGMDSISLEWTSENQLSFMQKVDPLFTADINHDAKTAVSDKGNLSDWLDNFSTQDYLPNYAVLMDSTDIDAAVYFNAEQKPYNLAFMYEVDGTTIFNLMDKTDLMAEGTIGGMAKVAYVDSFRNVEFFEDNLPKDVVAIAENVKLRNEKTAQEKQAAEVTVPSETEQPPQQQTAEPSIDTMPDPTITIADRDAYGYTAEDILPLNKEKALELFDKDHTVFMLYPDNEEAMVFEVLEIEAHDGIFGIEREDWQKTEEYHALVDTTEREAGQDIEAKAESTIPPLDALSTPVYKGDYKAALANDEQADFDNSGILNYECSQDIDKAIADNSKPGPMAGTQHVDIDKATRSVIEQYGPERVAWVLAGNVKAAENDGRFSSSTKEWAKSFDVPKAQTYHLNSHRTILESVINKFREIEKEKPSLMAALDKGEKRSKAEHGGITQPQKDSPDKSERKNNGER